MKRVLVYGDSNVWGDNFDTGIRIPFEKQWVNVLQRRFLNNYMFIQEGLSGRIAGRDSKEKVFKNGKDTFQSVFRTWAPVDIIIIALGTNDLQVKYSKTADEIIRDLLWYEEIIKTEYCDLDNRKKYFVNGKMPRFIYILPPCFDYLGGAKNIFNENSEEKRKDVVSYFVNNLQRNEVIVPGKISLLNDGIHFDFDGHKKMALLVEDVLNNENK